MARSLQRTLDYAQIFEDGALGNVKPLRMLLKIYKGHWLYISLSIITLLIKNSPAFVLPIVTANVINFVASPDKYELSYLWTNLAVVMVCIIQNIFTHTMHISYMSKAVRHVEAGLRSTLVRKMQQLSMSFHGEFNAGKMQSKLLRDVEAIDFLSRQFFVQVVPAFSNIVIAAVLTMMNSFTVSAFFIMTIPAAVLIIQLFRKRMTRFNNEFRRNIEEMSGKVSEIVEMMPVTRAHGLEETEVRKMDKMLDSIKKRGYRLDILEAYFGSTNWAVFQLFQMVCLFFTAYLAYQGKMPIGDIVMYQGFFGMILGGVTGLINVYPFMARGFESLYSVTEVLLSKDKEEYQGHRKPGVITGNVRFEHVGFKYRDSDRHVLQNFTLDVRPGETVAFVGESGSGKSTILNLLIGFFKPEEGKVLVDGIPLEEMNMKAYRQQLAIVLQNNILFSGSIRDNITYGLPQFDEAALQHAVDAANLREVVNNLPEGLDTMIGDRGGKLSGGQRQRIAIARAIVRDPRLIILDEATSALDNQSEKHVKEALQRLTHNRTTFIVAHRLSTVRHADRIVVLKKGQIVETGSYDELLEKQGEFYQLVQLQAM